MTTSVGRFIYEDWFRFLYVVEYVNQKCYNVSSVIFMKCFFVSLQRVPLDSSCWLPAFTVKLRDSSKCICPMRSYGAVTVTCTESDAFDLVHRSSGSATHHLGDAMSESPGPLEYDYVRGFLNPPPPFCHVLLFVYLVCTFCRFNRRPVVSRPEGTPCFKGTRNRLQ